MKSIILLISLTIAASIRRHRNNVPAQNYARLKSLLYRQGRQNNGTISANTVLLYKVHQDAKKISNLEAVITDLQGQFNQIRQELSGAPERSALYSKINIITDTIAGVSDVVEKRVTELDNEVKQVEKESKTTQEKMSQLSRQVRIESHKRALVADSLHGQESVLDLTRRRHFAMIVQLKRKIKELENELTEHYGSRA